MLSLSVIIPNFNHAEFLPESLDAILCQSFRPKEVVVVDDCSTDESCKIVEEYQKKHSNLHLIRLHKNSGGPIIPLQEGLKFITSDYVALCASDDMILPGFFEEAMNFLSNNYNLAACCGNLAIFKGGKPYQFKEVSYLSTDNPVIFTPDELTKTCFNTSFRIASQSCIYQSEILRKFKGYDAKLEGYSDFYLNYQIGFSHSIGYAPRLWATFRERERSYGMGLPLRKRFFLCQEFIKKLKKEPPEIRKRWIKSGILVYAHWMMWFSLMLRPLFWSFLPTILFKLSKIKKSKQENT